MALLGSRQKSAIDKAISTIRSESPEADITFDGTRIHTADDFIRMLELSRALDRDTVRLIIDQVESIAFVLRHQAENGSPEPKRLLYLKVDTSDQSPSWVDFEWKHGR